MKKVLLSTALIIQGLMVQAQTTFMREYGNFTGSGRSLIMNTNGNFVVASITNEEDPYYKQYAVREISPSGDILNFKAYGEGELFAHQIIQTNDGGYAIIGSSKSYNPSYRAIYMVKITTNGTLSWQKEFASSGSDFALGFVQTSTGEYFFAGGSGDYNNGSTDAFLVKTDVNGDTLWTKKYHGDKAEGLTSIRATSDGGLILGGYSIGPNYALQDIFLIKTNTDGDTLWTKTYTSTAEDWLSSIRQTSDGGYILAGSTGSGKYAPEYMYAIKTNATGDILWTKTLGHPNRPSESADIIETYDGGYAITGSIRVDSVGPATNAYLVKLNASGNMLWEKEFNPGLANGQSRPTDGLSLIQTPDSGLAISGAFYNGSSIALTLIKTNANGVLQVIPPPPERGLLIFPNPARESVRVEFGDSLSAPRSLQLIDNLGRVLRTIENITLHHVDIKTEAFARGVYYLRLYTDDGTMASAKLVLK